MSKRLHKTVLALSLGMMGLGTAHAQLVMEDGSGHPASPANAPTQQVVVTGAPRSGLLIVDGYDTPADPAPPVVVPVPPAAPVVVTSATSSAPVMVVASASATTPGVVEIGQRPAFINSPSGWGDGVPLSIALPLIVPKDFTVHADGVESQKVNWSGGRPWNTVLEMVARNGHLHVAILWDKKAVTVVSGDRPALIALPGETVVKTTTTVVVSQPSLAMSHPVTVMAMQPIQLAPAQTQPIAPQVETWTLNPNLSLRENVEAWVKKAGWNKLVWDGADYRVVAPATFTGQFDAPDGPLSSLIDGYAQSDQPLLVKLTTMDRVVHVSNKGYQPVEVEAVSAATLAPDVLKQSGVDPAAAAATSEAVQSGSKLAPITINDHAASGHSH